MPDLDAARRDLENALGPDGVLADPLGLRLYARDASMVEGSAGLVAFPTHARAGLRGLRGRRTARPRRRPRGSGTGLTGGSTPIGDALVIVTTKMRRILEIRPEDRLAWVEPGLFNLDLSIELRPTGFAYAPDPSSQQVSSIGGNVSTNAGGPHCLALGVTSATSAPSTSRCPTGGSNGSAPRAHSPPATTCAGSSSGPRARSAS